MRPVGVSEHSARTVEGLTDSQLATVMEAAPGNIRFWPKVDIQSEWDFRSVPLDTGPFRPPLVPQWSIFGGSF